MILVVAVAAHAASVAHGTSNKERAKPVATAGVGDEVQGSSITPRTTNLEVPTHSMSDKLLHACMFACMQTCNQPCIDIPTASG